ncbi:MAG: 50S ribosomal protein L9 [Candidatus Pacebacteria bacterium]|nr:50S ribosomal protein L9 [Candidatus Paceibacterota bacterium]MBP9866630.1 50S ribosomal protein L9 [Candidatus Paceibacterota bacterium]
MKVILLKDISKIGKRGDVKEVADGYAINVLIKKEMALRATPQELMKWKQKADSQDHKKALATNTFVQLIDAIRNEKVVITGKKADQKGQLFAAVHENDIVDAIFAVTKLSVDPKQILITGHIKSIGVHTLEIKQGDKKEKITIEIK